MTHDDVYNGDLAKWVKFANSLKLRLAVRVSHKLPGEAKNGQRKLFEQVSLKIMPRTQ